MKNVEALHNFSIWRRNLALDLYIPGFQHAYTYDHLLGGTVPILRHVIQVSWRNRHQPKWS